MTYFIEFLKIIGSVSGLVAGGLLLWDRFTKHYPIALIVPRPIMPNSQNISHYLYVKNVSDRPILVCWTHGNSAQLRVAKSHSLKNIVRSQLQGETTVSIWQQGDIYLPLLKPNNYAEIDPDNVLEIDLRWRFAQPRIWNADRKISISIRRRDFDSLVEDYIELNS